ncbi:hypothetical protein [Variovorax sp. MHTC-1]|uniref:hypothetical protein n=1 Tax=Variovorax sp. MHTC-1 TaxID=2495593 RepID=UPI000F879A43|nr:hypothetical protein [Variovorax sp. MHTC-1]RST50081.1 hypothetical protein EJI01_21930 [Variovorax sp. MHTC-1]
MAAGVHSTVDLVNALEQYGLAEPAYGEDMLNHVLARGYITKPVDNKRVFRCLQQQQAEVLTVRRDRSNGVGRDLRSRWHLGSAKQGKPILS